MSRNQEAVKKSGLPQALARRSLICNDLGAARLAVPAFFHSFRMTISIRSLLLLACLNLATACGPPPNPEPAGNASAPPRWEPLLSGQDLSNWEVVGGGKWTAGNGELLAQRLPGDSRAGWLVTREDFGDFKLRLKFKASGEHFNSGILIRDPGHAKFSRPAFHGYEIQIYNGDGDAEPNTSGAIYNLARSYFRKVDHTQWTEFEVHCSGDHIVSYMNGEKLAEIHDRRSYRGAIGLQLHGGRDDTEMRWKDIEIMRLPEAPRPFQLMEEEMEQAAGEFVPLLKTDSFGEAFDIYWEAGAKWSLQDGLLRGEHPEEISWIFTKESYADFVLAFDFRINHGGNAGVCLRFPWPAGGELDKGPAFLGYECQIMENDPLNPTGSIYNLARAYWTGAWKRPIHKREAWNHYRIYAKGDHLVTQVNRRKTAETHISRSASGRIGFQVHEPAQWVEYRNIEIKVVQ